MRQADEVTMAIEPSDGSDSVQAFTTIDADGNVVDSTVVPAPKTNMCDRCNERPWYKTTSSSERLCKKCLSKKCLKVGEQGETTTKRRNPGRNDPCLCGSGNKYKKCCLRRNLYLAG